MMDKADGKPSAAVASAKQETATTTASTPVKGKAVPDIALVNVPYGYNSGTNNLQELEKVTGRTKSKASLLAAVSPVGGVESIFWFKGSKSSIRLKTADSLSFLINSDKGTPDAFTLYRMESKKGNRETVYIKDELKGNERGSIQFHYARAKSDIYQIIPVAKLTPGEYCFVFEYSSVAYGDNRMDGYAFGID